MKLLYYKPENSPIDPLYSYPIEMLFKIHYGIISNWGKEVHYPVMSNTGYSMFNPGYPVIKDYIGVNILEYEE